MDIYISKASGDAMEHDLIKKFKVEEENTMQAIADLGPNHPQYKEQYIKFDQIEKKLIEAYDILKKS